MSNSQGQIFSPLGVTFGGRLSAYLTNYEDFRKHRRRLNKSLLKLRHDLNLVTRDTRNYRENERMSSISSESYSVDARNALVLLLVAERDTVHSLEIKSLLEVSGERMAPYRKLMGSKLKKAVSTCQKLVSVIGPEKNDAVKLEFYVYAALITGVYAVHKKHWSSAIYALSIARCGLETLCAHVQEDEESEGRFGRVLADELFSTLVDPSLGVALSQHSAHESTTDLRTISRNHSRDNTVSWLAPAVDLILSFDPDFFKDLSQDTIPKDITWRQHSAHLYNDELAQRLFVLQKLDWRTNSDSIDYDSIYSQWSALVDIHATDLAKNYDEDDAEKTQHGAIVLTYLKYNMLFTRIKRDLLLIEHLSQGSGGVAKVLSTNKDILKLYSSIVGTIEELSELPGVYNDEDLSQSLEQMANVFSAKKAITIANSYAAASKFPEALKVYLHVEKLVKSLQTGFTVQEFPYGVTSTEDVQQLKASVAKRLSQVHTLAELQSASGKSDYISENIHQFPTLDGLHKIAKFDSTAAIQPVLCKAVLFDVAFNYIGYSDGVERSVSTTSTFSTTEQNDKKKGGFFGIFGRA